MKKKRPKLPKEKEQKSSNQPEEKKSDRPDFGGIPTRDLKKNLGCG